MTASTDELVDGSLAPRSIVGGAAVCEGDVGARAPVRASRRVSFLASGANDSTAQLLRGAYQSPILVQGQPAERQERRVEIVLSELS